MSVIRRLTNWVAPDAALRSIGYVPGFHCIGCLRGSGCVLRAVMA